MAPSDEELLRLALDDESLLKGAREHLEQCAICRQRLDRYKYTESFLSVQLYRSQCPSATELNYYCAQLLSADECIRLVDHLKMCPICALEVVDIRRIFADFDPFPEAKIPSPLAVIKRVIASLVPWQPQMAMRSDASQSSWPRQYRADALNISLHLSRASNGETMLLGLFTSTDPDESVEAFEGVIVELCPLIVHSEDNQGDEGIDASLMHTRVDDLGNMAFKAVPAGEYVMIVRLPDVELVIKGLTIEHG